MSTVQDVLTEYHKKVPFPWTLRKIKKAGFNPTKLFINLGRKLERCEDIGSPEGRAVLELIDQLQLI